MGEPERVSASEVYDKVKEGKAALVCAYEDDEKCNRMHLEGAINFSEFKQKIGSLPKDEDIVFYCA